MKIVLNHVAFINLDVKSVDYKTSSQMQDFMQVFSVFWLLGFVGFCKVKMVLTLLMNQEWCFNLCTCSLNRPCKEMDEIVCTTFGVHN